MPLIIIYGPKNSPIFLINNANKLETTKGLLCAIDFSISDLEYIQNLYPIKDNNDITKKVKILYKIIYKSGRLD